MKKETFALTVMLAIVAASAFGQQAATIHAQSNASSNTYSSSPFDKIWSVALSQFNQSDQFSDSVTQLTNGTLVAGGGDGGNQPNSCNCAAIHSQHTVIKTDYVDPITIDDLKPSRSALGCKDPEVA